MRSCAESCLGRYSLPCKAPANLHPLKKDAEYEGSSGLLLIC